MYKNNQLFVKLTDGLLKPFRTTIGVKQGCIFSPILFNIFINKITNIFDASCDPLKVNDKDLSCLLWADDLLLVSSSSQGLQNSLNKMESFYNSLGLKINIKKTEIIIFNKRGLKLDNCFDFRLNGQKVKIVDEYQYLGLKLKPSGSMNLAMQVLHDKASRAWFGISNVIFKNKRMEVDKIFNVFDSLVTPVALYGCEFWLPLVLPKKCFSSCQNLLSFWKDFSCEKNNQKCARITLSVNRKTSRLAVLGELGRYPLLIKALSHCLNYKMSLLRPNSQQSSLLRDVIHEMKTMTSRSSDCWLSRVDKIQKLLNIPDRPNFVRVQGQNSKKYVQSKFDKFWSDNLNSWGYNRGNPDQTDHNKLRTYRLFKSSFTKEPYIDLVRNRNQRAFLTRLRVGSHLLNIERGRWTRPVTPVEHRICSYCAPSSSASTSPRSRPTTSSIDDEYHFLMNCSRFKDVRDSGFQDISLILPNFANLSTMNQFRTLLCPTKAKAVKIVNNLIKEMFKLREKIDNQP